MKDKRSSVLLQWSAPVLKLVAAPDYHEQNRFAKAEALYNLVNQQSGGLTESTTPINNG